MRRTAKTVMGNVARARGVARFMDHTASMLDIIAEEVGVPNYQSAQLAVAGFEGDVEFASTLMEMFQASTPLGQKERKTRVALLRKLADALDF